MRSVPGSMGCRRVLSILSVLLLAVPVLSCGGGGGGGSGQALDGTWVSQCFARDTTYAWEKYVYDGQTGELEGRLETFQTGDCSGVADTQASGRGTFVVGGEVQCASGHDGLCRELDISFEGESTKYTLFSVFPENPPILYMGSHSMDPADRPNDVTIEEHHKLRYVPLPDHTADTVQAVVGLTVRDSGISGTPPAVDGYEALFFDLNGGSGGAFIWLYYRMGRPDGLEGTPIGKIYTVHETDGEEPLSAGDVRIDVNLNGSTFPNNRLYLYYRTATAGPLVRCVAAANQTKGVMVDGPDGVSWLYSITWVQELEPDGVKVPQEYPQGEDAQDLNEGQGFLTDYVFIGYGAQ